MAYTYDMYSPIEKVDNAYIPTPCEYQWSVQDISQSDAGRTEDGKMHKKKIGEKVKLQLKWNYIKTADVSAILQAFRPEYFTVKYLDAMEGLYLTKTFYCGDKISPVYNSMLGIWSVSFNIIEQ